LGDRLIDSVRVTLDVVARWPNSGTPTAERRHRKTVERRITTSGFLYAIRHRTLDDVVAVLAIYHQRRHPDFGTDRSP